MKRNFIIISLMLCLGVPAFTGCCCNTSDLDEVQQSITNVLGEVYVTKTVVLIETTAENTPGLTVDEIIDKLINDVGGIDDDIKFSRTTGENVVILTAKDAKTIEVKYNYKNGEETFFDEVTIP